MRTFKLSLFMLFCIMAEGQAKIMTIPANNVLTAKFTQQRHLKGIPPLKSEGSMIMYEGHGLIWTTTKPFPNSILITKKGLYQLEDNTKTAIVKAGGESAMFDAMASIFSIAPGKEVEGFNLEELPAADQKWKLRLVPKSQQVSNFIQSITVEGKEYISHITISRPNGDHDEIALVEHTLEKNASPAVRSQFEN